MDANSSTVRQAFGFTFHGMFSLSNE